MIPTVSVIMSVHNGEDYLKEAVDGILLQTYTDFEFIIIDDGSTDGTFEILKSYTDPRLKIIRQENQGLTRSLNIAMGQARGQFIARHDADDRSFPHRLASQLAFLSTHQDIGMVGSAVEVISSSGKPLATFRHPTQPAEIQQTLKRYNCFWHGSVMFRRECFTASGGYDERFRTAQDYELWLRFSERYRLANLAEPLYAYRFTTDSVTVRKMVSQHRFAELARKMACEREKAPCFTINSQEIADYLSSPLTESEKNQIICNYKPWCRLLLANGLFEEAARLMTELFSYHRNPFFRLAFLIGRNVNPKKNLLRFLEHA